MLLKKPTRAKKHKTAADKARFEKLKRLGCCVCHYGGNPADIHHIETGMGRRKRHDRTIPLCKFHHVDSRVSVHGNKSGFEYFFGTEAELLAKVNALLERMG